MSKEQEDRPAFLAQLRRSLARRKLARTGAKLAQVASEVSYRSESAFSRAFVRRLRITLVDACNSVPCVHSLGL
ncbi:helix-turn-helix domain-containing protein [Bradyrhizobium cenepequi]